MSSPIKTVTVVPGVRRIGWLFAFLPALLVALWLAPSVAQAGTITIVDGPNTPPVNGVVTDGFIQTQLASGNVVITTTGVITGPDEIRVLPGVSITWASGNQLTLDAGSSVIISGTIQHDGPANGAGGLQLLARGSPNSAVILGTGTQTTSVAAGSRFGLTRVRAGNLILQGGSGGLQPFAQLGFHTTNGGLAYTVTGAISVTVGQNVTATGGITNLAFVQIGHGGADASPPVTVTGNLSGPIAVEAGRDVVIQGGSNINANTAYAVLGNGGVGVGGNHGGDHRLAAGGNVTFQGGGQVGYVQMGNGGLGEAGSHSGNHTLNAGGDVSFQSGISGTVFSYAQFGNGGAQAAGNHSGSHRLRAAGDVSFRAGSGATQFSYVQYGNGGFTAVGNHSGGHSLTAGGNVTFQGGDNNSMFSSAQYGNGGFTAIGNHSGGHSLTAGGNVSFQGGSGLQFYEAVYGNGGFVATGNHSGDHYLRAAGDVSFRGGNAALAQAQYGNGGVSAAGNQSGNQSLVAGGDVTFQGGSNQVSYAQFGNGGVSAAGNQSGNKTLNAGGDVSFLGGSSLNSYAQYGNGGPGTGGSLSGSLALTATGSLTVSVGITVGTYAMIGHGSDIRVNLVNQSLGDRAGDIRVRVGATAVFSGSQVGHLTASGVLSVTAGNTLIGVSQNNPFSNGTGKLLVTGVTTTSFSSAPVTNTGQLRIYLPRADSQQVPTNATFNGSSFATANTIPPAQLAGIAPFGAGPYIPPYSFYLGGQPNVAVTKTATPAGPLNPSQTLTYTISFSNTGNITATGVVISDTLPAALSFTSVTPEPDAGITISQTGNAPNLAWSVSALGTGKGGRIRIVTSVVNSPLLLGLTFTNTATISATGDITLSNNASAVARSVIAGASLTITKTVVGTAPGNAWQFNGSAGIFDFTLPAGGGSQSFTPLVPGAYTVTETVKSGYTAAVSCTNGASGTSSVSVNLAAGQQVGCTFTNTFSTPPQQTGRVSGLVYVDENGNAQSDTNEGLEGVTVTLQSATGVAAALTVTDVTDSDGEYRFLNIPVGQYTLSFVPPAGYLAMANAQVTVIADQTVQVPDQIAIREGPGILGDVFLPVLQR